MATRTYFATMGIPLRAGRYFDEHDDANPGPVLLVNQTMARKYWPGENAVGKRLKLTSRRSARRGSRWWAWWAMCAISPWISNRAPKFTGPTW